MVNPIISQVTMEMIHDSLLSRGESLRVKRNKKQQISRIAVLGLSPRKKIVETEVYTWRPNHV